MCTLTLPVLVGDRKRERLEHDVLCVYCDLITGSTTRRCCVPNHERCAYISFLFLLHVVLLKQLFRLFEVTMLSFCLEKLFM